MCGTEKVRKRDSSRREVGQGGNRGQQGHRKATELSEVVLFSKERPSRPLCPRWPQRNRGPVVFGQPHAAGLSEKYVHQSASSLP